MSSIRIISTPVGFAEDEIRQKWIDVVIPLVPDDEALLALIGFSWLADENVGGYIVRGDDAIQALFAANEESAALYWSSPVFPPYFMFARSCCTIELMQEGAHEPQRLVKLLHVEAVKRDWQPMELIKMALLMYLDPPESPNNKNVLDPISARKILQHHFEVIGPETRQRLFAPFEKKIIAEMEAERISDENVEEFVDELVKRYRTTPL